MNATKPARLTDNQRNLLSDLRAHGTLAALDTEARALRILVGRGLASESFRPGSRLCYFTITAAGLAAIK